MAAPKAFTEYNDGTTMWGQAHWWRVLYNGIWSSGAQHAYVVDYNGITEKLYMQIDGVTKAPTPWSPNLEWSNPWGGDDIPGTAGARTDYSLVAVRHCAGCIWQAPVSNFVVISWPYYKFVWTANPTAFQIYTQR